MSTKGGAPQAPDPIATANAQTASNRETAIAQAGLNAVNQVTPLGNLSYTQNGTWSDGTPKFTATQTYSPEMQGVFQSGIKTQQNLANLAQEQSGRIGTLLGKDFSLNNDAVEGRLMELSRTRLDPLLDERREKAEASLAARGIREGSTAYDRSIRNVDNAENDALVQLLLGGRSQAINELMTERTQPLNEILALAGQGQIQQPSFVPTSQTPVAGTDVAGITQQGYANQMNAYNQQQQGFNQMMGGLFSAGAALLPLSDMRAKTDIRRIGTADNGLGVYVYRLKGERHYQIGFMAQEVAEINPDAVTLAGDGFLHVDYEKAVA